MLNDKLKVGLILDRIQDKIEDLQIS
jgi:hypothetical protein